MLKLYSIIIGEDPAYTANYQQQSKRKVALFANCLVVPVILWFINGYLLVRNVLEESVFSAVLTATIIAFIIFLIERAIVMTNGSKIIFWFRIFLGVIVALLGSISLDEVIFKHDIDNQVAQYKKDEIDNAVQNVAGSYQSQINLQQSIVSKKYEDWQSRLDDVNLEMKGGPKSSGYKGKGDIANENIHMASLLQADYLSENAKLELLKQNIETSTTQAKMKAEANFNGNALLVRIRAMFDLIAKDKFMLFVYALFTLFLFCIEFLVVLIKIGSKNSIDEDLEKARELLLRIKTRKVLEKSEAYYQPERLLPSVQTANELANKNNASVF